ncbi:MAG: branched-chain amino acid ABC transporter substrate-binding protein [Patescibacteria group bacterium]
MVEKSFVSNKIVLGSVGVITLLLVLMFMYNSGQKKEIAGAMSSIKIGVTLPLTGELSALGQDSKAGVAAAIKDFEIRTGYKVQVDFQNDECKGTQANSNVSKFVNIDKVSGIIGPLCSGAGVASMPVANDSKTVMISGSTSASSISSLGDFVFRTFPSDAIAGIKAAEHMYSLKNLKNVAVMFSNNEYGKGLSDVFTNKYKSLGGEVSSNSGFNETDSDFSAEISKIIENKAEGIFFPAYPNNAVAFLKQAKEKGLNIYTLGTDAISGKDVIGVDNIYEGKDLILPNSDFGPEAHKKIAKSAGLDESTKFNLYAFTNYDATDALLEAIYNSNNASGDQIKNEVYKTNKKGVSTDKLKFNADGDLETPDYKIYSVKNSELVAY